MYVVGVSSKLSNTIFTYKTWFLSYPPLSPFFLPFPADKRQCSCFFLETGTSKYPSIGSNSVALVNQGFGVAEEQVTPISTTYGSIMFLTKLLTLPAVTQAMGTCYLGFGSKTAIKPSHPQCLVSVHQRLPPFLLCWLCGLWSSLKTDHWIMQIKISPGQ